jgi:hypothetical protein
MEKRFGSFWTITQAGHYIKDVTHEKNLSTQQKKMCANTRFFKKNVNQTGEKDY